ncbi:MAG: S-methyl-5-thioribose kinase [Moraxellaceae bacterium]|nr:S-methyl-5-thioribose kinase [Moraxellaceae bacterium]MDZ4387413.1 S-methyl-5-thioribose kinase [Moraxellaceae bacterium]
MSYFALSLATLPDYLKSRGLAAEFLAKDESLQCSDLADGNLNLVFRVQNQAGQSVIVKQSLPWARKYPDFALPLTRAKLEQDLLQSYLDYCPDYVPKVYHYDDTMYACVMEDLKDHCILRTGLLAGRTYAHLATHLGDFLARSLFFSSDFAVDSATKKARVTQFTNPVLVKAQEDVCFTQPLINHPNNHCHPELMPLALSLRADVKLHAQVLRCKWLYMTRAEALLHGDLHTGSIMVTDHDTRIIDPEFGFYGPMAYDIGCLLANLYIAAMVQEQPDNQRWLTQVMVDTWLVFEQRFAELAKHHSIQGEWDNPYIIADFLTELRGDSLRFAGVELIRRTIGLAHVPEWEDMTPARIAAAKQCLLTAKAWLCPAAPITSITEALQLP